MAIEPSPIYYLSYAEAVTLHILLMRQRRETRFGVFDPALLKSTLARPRHAAVYEEADLIRQAATLCFGLVKNHPWVGGNKRTATFLVDRFLNRNGINTQASLNDTVALVLAVESGQWGVDDITEWYRQHTVPKSVG
ncbi:MAG: type II toxin-antitoxin system death-on-curing family toxin [Acidobacteriota bacterium]